MVRTYLLCLLLLLAAEVGHAQVFSPRSLREDTDTGKLYVRMNPAGLLDLLDQNITIGSEFRFNNTWSLIMDAGYIFYSQYLPRTRGVSGVLLRPGIRMYAGKSKDFFIDLQFHYKEVKYQARDWVDKDVVNNVASYEEFKPFRYRKRVTGVHITCGGKEYLSRNRRFFMEVYAGIGIHYKQEGLIDEPNSRYNPPRSVFVANDSTAATNRWLPALPFGVRLVYRFR